MSQDLHQHAELIFSEAIDRFGSARTDYLAHACGEDPNLRDEVNLLIDHYESAENVLTAPGHVSHALTTGPNDELNLSIRGDGAEASIGSYKMIEVLSESELGSAYLVEHSDSEERCRLNLYRTPPNRSRSMGRFRVLGDQLMQTPLHGYAAHLESGTVETGRGQQPFTITVHSDAPSLLQHADASGLSIDARVDLLHRIGETISQLHRVGIIHGDLRPETVLVRTNGSPCLLDTGIARALDLPHSLTVKDDGTISTDSQAPEHLDGACDTLGDVYALGQLGSVLLRDAGEAALQAICDKACAQDPTHRYGSADAMIRDLDRYSCNKPIEAVRSGFLAECRSLITRHPASTACTIIAVVIMALMCVLLGAFAFSS